MHNESVPGDHRHVFDQRGNLDIVEIEDMARGGWALHLRVGYRRSAGAEGRRQGESLDLHSTRSSKT